MKGKLFVLVRVASLSTNLSRCNCMSLAASRLAGTVWQTLLTCALAYLIQQGGMLLC